MKKLFLLLTVFSLFALSCNKKKTDSTVIQPKFISDADVPTVLNTSELVVLDFWASWCGPCRSMDPVLKDFANEYKDVTFVKIDVDKHRQTKEQYDVWGLPTLVFIKDGKEVSRQVGLTTEGTVKNKIERWR